MELRALFPFVVPEPLGVDKCLVGREATGGLFCFDPWDCYAKGLLTNSNIFVFGQIGRGKSAFVKSLVWRQLSFGRRCWVLDPKGEYGPLAAATGAPSLSIGPGMGLRLNPLDLAAGGPDQAEQPSVHQRRSELLGTLLSTSLGRPLAPPERAAADIALAAVEGRSRVPTLPAVAEALLQPSPEHARLLATDVEGLRKDGRNVALELRRLVDGDLAGIFDGETSPLAERLHPVTVLDLSRLYSSPALGLFMVCALSWLQGDLAKGLRAGPGPAGDGGGPGAPGPPKRLVVLDEAWAVLSHLPTARWLQAVFKLSRAYGVCNIAVLHRVSDLEAAGGAGSEQQRLAEGLLSDAETRVVFGQAPGEATKAAKLLGLSATEQELLGRLGRGAALWHVGTRTFLVQHDLSEEERRLGDTDAAMRANPRELVGVPTGPAGTGG